MFIYETIEENKKLKEENSILIEFIMYLEPCVDINYLNLGINSSNKEVTSIIDVYNIFRKNRKEK